MKKGFSRILRNYSQTIYGTVCNDPFSLPEDFLEEYKKKSPNFGFDGLGEVVYYRSYSRMNEHWCDTVQRVVEGTFCMQKEHILSENLQWDQKKATESAIKMYEKMFEFKFLPAGRGLYAMGTDVIKIKELYASLNSCAFISTENIDKDYSKCFAFMMDLLFLGVGVGFDCKGSGKITIKPTNKKERELFVIEDTREGWVNSLRKILDSYFFGLNEVEFDYSLIRDHGEPIKITGGICAGARPLADLHETLRIILDENAGKKIGVKLIVDIMNLIGKCLSSENPRTAEISFGSCDDEEFFDLKNYEINPERISYGWVSNNSIFAELGMDYSPISERIMNNGEPGLAWLDNMREYSRMGGDKDYVDINADGCNPCVEQTLESYEMCCLVETFPYHHDSLEEYLETLKYAFMYGKTGKSHWPETNDVLLRNRRIGVSMSGVTQFLDNRGINELKIWCEAGYDRIQEYDEEFSDLFKINKSIKTTSVKPSGTISLLAGATPGVHFTEAKHYIRRLRIKKDSNLIEPIRNAGFKIEEDVSNNNNLVVEFPCELEGNIRTSREVSMWEKLHIAAFMQRYWSDNQVSCTITFDKNEEGGEIENALNFFQYQLKGVSFLPTNGKTNPFPQMPYEEITHEQYLIETENIKGLEFDDSAGEEESEEEKYCSNDSCTL